MKKCPNCNSSRYSNNNGVSHCNKCGFENDISDDNGIPELKESIKIPEKKTNIDKIITLTKKSIDDYENFYHNFEEDSNPYAKIKQDEEIKKILKNIVRRINQIKELAEEEIKTK